MEETANFADVIKLLRRRSWVIAVVLVVAVMLAALFSYDLLPPAYEADTSLIVNERSNASQDTGGIDYGQIQTSRSLAVTYAKIITSRAILQDTIDALGLNMSTKQLEKMTTVQVEGDTEIIMIGVKDLDPTRAADIANTIATSFIRQLPAFVSRVENVSVIDPAIAVMDQVSPRPVLNMVVASAAGLVLGVLLAFAVDYFDDTAKSAEDVRKLFGLRVLAAIPDGTSRRTGNKPDSTDESVRRPGDYRGSRSPAAEAYRVLRTNLQFAAVDKELKVILVTSPSPDEGKSTVAQYLAQTVSQSGRKVLILDTDLINPTLHRRFGLPNQSGLSNLIVGGIDAAVVAHPKGFPNLSVITSGPIPPNSSELLGSARMKHLMDHAREEYDVIIVDSPPVLAVTDAIVTSSLADGVLLVVHAGRTHSADVRRAQEALGSARANLLGVVLNRVHVRGSAYRSAYAYLAPRADSEGSRETPKADS